MAVSKEVGELIAAFTQLLVRIDQGHRCTEEGCKAINEMTRMIALETSLYHLERLAPASDTSH